MHDSLHHLAAIAIVVGWTLGFSAHAPGQQAGVRAAGTPLISESFVQPSQEEALTDPAADPKAEVVVGKARFTVLTPELIRMEWAADGKFEDHASFVFLNRRLPVPKFDRSESDRGRRLTIKTDSSSVAIYDRVEEVVSYPRSWRRGQTFGADRFEKILAEDRPAARRSQAQQRLLDSLDSLCSRSLVEAYLRDMADTDRSLGRQISELLELIRQYGPEDVSGAIEKAAVARAFGADYVANILRQQRSPRRPQPPLRLRDPLLNELATDPISLREYDAFILESGKECDDSSRTETAATESESDESPSGGDDC